MQPAGLVSHGAERRRAGRSGARRRVSANVSHIGRRRPAGVGIDWLDEAKLNRVRLERALRQLCEGIAGAY